MARRKQKNIIAPDIDSFSEVLRAKGLRATSQRIAVHRAMLELGHASADEIASKIAEHQLASFRAGMFTSGKTITVASVYNILSQLTELGIYSQRLSANSKMYYDITVGRHLHLYDRVNHEFIDIYDDELLDTVAAMLKKRRFAGYRVDDIDIGIICHPTRKKKL